MEYFIELYNTHQLESILLVITALALSIQLFYYFRFYLPLALYKEPTLQEDLPPVSVIICASNEANNLTINLPLIFQQEYPTGFEVIVVNDASEDDSEYVLAKFKENHNNLYFTNIPYDRRFTHGKKLALTLGVKAAKNEHLVLTDADCNPANKNWLKHMASSLIQKDIVLGFGAYKRKKGFTNKLLRYDTFMIAVQYLSFALAKKPYMGVGRNLAYTKSIFNKNQGFKNHAHILSGDDDLFIQEVANKDNVIIKTSPESQTISEPSETFSQWCRQKRRHLTSSPLYKYKTKQIIGIEAMSRYLFWSCAILSMFFSTFATPIFILFFIKLAIQLLILGKISRNLGQKSIIWVGIIFDFLLPIITAILLLGSKRNAKRNRWT